MTPEEIVQRQFDAYNAKDLEAWAATYAPDAEQFVLHGARLARGHDEIRARMAQRFTEPDLHAALLTRVVMGNIVIDHERVTRNFPEGRGSVELLCIYEVKDGRIQRASFSFGPTKLG